jgi:hypothetical protein
VKVLEQTYLGKPALALIPESLHERDLIERCLGAVYPLKVGGVLRGFECEDFSNSFAVLWNSSVVRRQECAPEQAGLGPEIRMVRKRADLGAFMNALRRYINNIIDFRLYETVRNVSGIDEEAYKDKIHEAAQELQKIIKPLFEEEVH